MAELTLGSLNLHMGRGAGRHDAPFYDVATACKEVDTDMLVVERGCGSDGGRGQVTVAAARIEPGAAPRRRSPTTA
jgi:hypothetical protein